VNLGVCAPHKGASHRLTRKRRSRDNSAILSRVAWLRWAIVLALLPSQASADQPKAPTLPSFVSAHYGRPQTLVPIFNGRRLNLVCVGEGKPTVLLLSGLGGGTFDWRGVQPEMGKDTRVCAYDRAGYGFSDPSPEPGDVLHALLDLRALLHSGRISLPVVLVAHSLSGVYAVAYAKRYPEDVAAMVLVDPAFTNQSKSIAEAVGPVAAAKLEASTAGTVSFLDRCVALAQSGQLSSPAMAASDCLDNPADPDPDVHRERDREAKMAGYQRAIRSEFQNANVVGPDGRTIDDRQSGAIIGDLGAMPLSVLTRGKKGSLSGLSPTEIESAEAAWREGHDQLAGLSRMGSNELIPDSDHFIQLDHPDAVVERIRSVLAQAHR